MKIIRGATNIPKIIITIVFIVFIMFYAYNRSENLLFGPQITIKTPINGQVIQSDLVNISGIIKNATEIRLNDRKIYTDENGNFQEEILLSYGYNVIELTAVDRFGKEKEKILQLVYK